MDVLQAVDALLAGKLVPEGLSARLREIPGVRRMHDGLLDEVLSSIVT